METDSHDVPGTDECEAEANKGKFIGEIFMFLFISALSYFGYAGL